MEKLPLATTASSHSLGSYATGTSHPSPVPWGQPSPFPAERVQPLRSDAFRRYVGLSGFNQTRDAELILVLNWLSLMFVAYLPYHGIYLWHKLRLCFSLSTNKSITLVSGAGTVAL